MIKRVTLGEELVITVKNKIGIMAEISEMLANRGINIESALGYASGKTAKLMRVTTANIAILSDLKKKYKSVKETEVSMVELEDKPGAMKIVTTELKKAKIDRLSDVGVETLPTPKKPKLKDPGKIVPDWEGEPARPTSRDLSDLM